MSHVRESQATTALDHGRTVEQLVAADSTTVEWLVLRSESSGVTLVRHRVSNVGSDDFLDVYEFPPLDPEEEHGEGVVLATFQDGAEALDGGVRYGALSDRWVNCGMVPDEYSDASKT